MSVRPFGSPNGRLQHGIRYKVAIIHLLTTGVVASQAHAQSETPAEFTQQPMAPSTISSTPPHGLASGQSPAALGSHITARKVFQLVIGSGELISLPVVAGTVFVVDPTVADVQLPTTKSVFVFGKKLGKTTLFALARDGRPIAAYNLVVDYDQSAFQATAASEAPGAAIRLERSPHGLIVTGTVPSPEAAANLEEAGRGYLGPGDQLQDQMKVTGSTQVNLRVRVAEVSRSISRQLGFNWNVIFNNIGSFAVGLQTGGVASSALSSLSSAASSTSSTDAISGTVASRHANGTLALDAMADEGLVTLLAEPNLTTTSGEPASFLAGGEYPIPIPQGLGSVAIQYKRYGVSVDFTPTVLSTGLISMKVSPEVSELSTTGSYAISGTSTVVPALVTRRAQTTVQLASGQSFAIGGLIQNNAQNNVSKIPWLGDLPVLGTLFRSTQFQRDETELIIVVTAYVVNPTDRVPPLPTDYVRQPSDFERLLLGRVVAPKQPTLDPERAPRLHGAAGFLFQ